MTASTSWSSASPRWRTASARSDGDGWTCLAVHRATRQWAVGQADTQSAAAMAAYEALCPGP